MASLLRMIYYLREKETSGMRDDVNFGFGGDGRQYLYIVEAVVGCIKDLGLSYEAALSRVKESWDVDGMLEYLEATPDELKAEVVKAYEYWTRNN